MDKAIDTTATEPGTTTGTGTGTGTGTTVVQAVKVVLLWALALACTVASGLCKEVGFMAFPAFLCIDLFVSPALARATRGLPFAVEGAAAGGTAAGSARGAGGGRRFLLGGLVQASTLVRTAATLVFGAWVLRVRMSLHEGQPLRVWDVMENHIMHEPAWFKRVLNYAYVHAR